MKLIDCVSGYLAVNYQKSLNLMGPMIRLRSGMECGEVTLGYS